MASKVNFTKVDRAFFKSAEFRQIVRLGAAVFDPRMQGGFARLIQSQQSAWPELSAAYAEWKAKKGLSPDRWIATGRTQRALDAGELPRKEGTRKGVRFKITPGRLHATLRVATFGRRGRKPGSEVQKRIFKNMNYGIDGQKKAKAIRSKSGRILNGFPARPLFAWFRSDVKPIEQALDKEAQAIFRESGF